MSETQLQPIEQTLPRVDEYFGVWAIEQDRFDAIANYISQVGIHNHIAQVQANGGVEQAKASSTIETQAGGIQSNLAVIQMRGVLMKQASSMTESTSTVKVRQQVRAAANDSKIDGILLMVDSPGGTVSGTMDLAAEVAEANKKKPVHVFVEDLAASAAYWVASQADAIYANNANALIGSIGTRMVVHDSSKFFENEGIRAISIATGAYKAVGTAGVEITEEHEAYLRERVDQMQEQFAGAVATGRGISAKAVGDLEAKVFVSAEAQQHKLIDGVASFDEALATLASATVNRPKTGQARAEGSGVNESIEIKPGESGVACAESEPDHSALSGQEQETTMSTEQTNATAQKEPVAATRDQIVEACIGLDMKADSDKLFVADQIVAGATIEQAQRAWMETQQARIQNRENEANNARKQAEAQANMPGVDPVSSESQSTADGQVSATETFEQLVRDEMKERGIARHEAHRAVCDKYPDARDAWVAEVNVKHHEEQRRKARRK